MSNRLLDSPQNRRTDPLPYAALLNPNAGSFRTDFDQLFPLPDDSSLATPSIHRFKLAYFQWEITQDPTPFWQNFGRLLRFPPPIQELASEVYRNLTANTTEYYSVHLRLEADLGEAWGTFDDQAAQYTRRLLRRNLKLVYLAGGDASLRSRYQDYLLDSAGRTDIQVVEKTSLLSPKSLKRLQALHWDNQAQVDYLVLLKAKFHAGSGPSSFSSNIGVRRHLLTSRKDKVFNYYEEDELSYLFLGDSASFMRAAMWP